MTPFYLQSPYFEIGIFAATLVIAYALLSAFGGVGNRQKRIAQVADRARGKIVMAEAGSMGTLRRKTGDASLPLLNRMVDAMPSLTALRARLERAGKTISAERYIAICLGILLTATLLATLLLKKGIVLAIFLGIILGIGVPHAMLGIWAGKRIRLFVRLFPDALDLIVRGLRSGLPVGESIKLVAHEVPDPVAGTFQTIADTMKLGVPLEKILTDMAKRMQCTEFNFFVTSIILQRETGGNLSEILNNLSEVLRKRTMMREKIKAMTSEARASMIIIGVLPFFVAAAVSFMSPGYLAPLWEDYRGNMMLGGAIASLCSGIGIMTKMSRFEI